MLVDARLGDPALTDELFPAYSGRPAGHRGPGGRRAAPRPGGPARAGAPAVAAGSGRLAATAVDRRAGRSAADPARPGSRSPALANAIPAIAGLAPARDLVDDGGVGSNNWVVAPSQVGDRHRAARQRPAPGLQHAVGVVRERPPLPPGLDRLPVRRRGRHVPRHPGRGRRPQRAASPGASPTPNPDVQDLVEEKVDPGRPVPLPHRRTAPRPFTVRTETIKVAGGDDVTLTVRETSHGPILNDVDTRLAGQRRAVRPALDRARGAGPRRSRRSWPSTARATGRRSGTRSASSAPRRRTSCTRTWTATSATRCRARSRSAPTRPTTGLRPVPGWDGKHEWVGRTSRSTSCPSVFDPPSGRIVTANNTIDGGDAFIGVEFDRGDRAARILELLDAAGHQRDPGHDGRDPGRHAAAAGRADDARAAGPGARARAPPTGRAVLDAIAPLGRPLRHAARPAAPRTSSFEIALERALFDDDLGPQARDYVGSGYAQDLAAALVGTAAGPSVRLVGRPSRPGPARPAVDVTAAALDTAGAWLRRDAGRPVELDLGPDPQDRLPGGHAGRQRDRPARVVLRLVAGRRRRGRRRRRQHLLPARPRVPGPDGPDGQGRGHAARACSTSPTGRRCGRCTTWATSTPAGSSRRPARAASRSAGTPTTGWPGGSPTRRCRCRSPTAAIDAAAAATLVLEPGP